MGRAVQTYCGNQESATVQIPSGKINLRSTCIKRYNDEIRNSNNTPRGPKQNPTPDPGKSEMETEEKNNEKSVDDIVKYNILQKPQTSRDSRQLPA